MYTAKGRLDIDAMLQRYSPLVRRLAHQMIAKLPANVEIDDLIQVGMIGLTDALNRFDVEQGVQFETFATQRIRGAMLDELRGSDWMSRGTRKHQREIEAAVHRLEQRLSHNERLASIGRLAAGVAHEIGNPVTGIACLAQNLKAENHDPELRDASQQILEQTQRISRIVQSLVGFARADSPSQSREGVEIRAVVEEAIQLLQLAPEGRDFEFENACGAGVLVAGDSQRLTQVFINLLGNARDASPPGGRIVTRASTHGPQVRIEIEDFGSGLPAGEIRNTLFEPFVTTKQTGKGTGLGLALVHGIVTEHEGRIQLIDKGDYDQGQGVIVQIVLPAWQDGEKY